MDILIATIVVGVIGLILGVADCRAAALAGLNPWACAHGCLGFGSCVKACGYDAIHVLDGAAVVDPAKCVGCGKCAEKCPTHAVELAE